MKPQAGRPAGLTPALPHALMPLMPLLPLLLAVLAGCASLTAPPAAPPAAPPTAPPPGAPPASASGSGPQQRAGLVEALAIEQRWLQSWFRGTPVVISRPADDLLSVEVPREFCFDAGRSAVKPALAAVLDKVAESLRRRPATHLVLLAAPSDRHGGEALAMQRAERVHRYLRDRGVRTVSMDRPTATSAAAVQLRIGAPPP